MKRNSILAAALAVLLATGFTSCRKSKLTQMVDQANATCPLKVANGFWIMQIVDDGNDIVYRYEYTDSLYNAADIQAGITKPGVKEQIPRMLAANKATAGLADAIVKQKRGLRYVYYNGTHSDSLVLSVTPQEFAEAIGK